MSALTLKMKVVWFPARIEAQVRRGFDWISRFQMGRSTAEGGGKWG